MKTMKIALLTNTISRPGGAEYVTIAMFNALSKLDKVSVKILSREREIDRSALEKWIGRNLAYAIAGNHEDIPRFPLNLLRLMNYDIVINTRSNEVLSPAHIHYVHWIFSPYGIKEPEVLTYYRSAYNIRGLSIKEIARHILHFLQLKITKLVLANSKYVAYLLKELGITAKVLYPPVRSRKIMNYTSTISWHNKKKIIITISRIAPGKQLELLPAVASRVKEARFVLIGSLYDKNYYNELMKLKEKLGVSNFEILPNLPENKLYELLGNAMIYLHTAHHEQFGIAVVEGMAAGCIPVVHRSGGPWTDILNENTTYGYSYTDIEELISIVTEILSNPNRYKDTSENARKRSLIFDESIFSLKFRTLVRDIISKIRNTS